MPCYHPLPAWYGRKRDRTTGVRPVVLRLAEGDERRPLELPCGRCIGCRLERSRQWAVRCMHEAKLYDENVFVTLTYSELPPGGSLRPEDYQLFMKRLRWAKGEGVRFFQCGEYGEALGRPHHHALLFNCAFEDRRFYKERGGVQLFTSKELDGLWKHGQCTLGAVSFESAAYVARYTLKKVFGTPAEVEAHYRGRVPEYLTMSRRPGLGRVWAERYRTDFYPTDQVVVRGHPTRPPRYYDQVEEKFAPSVLARVKSARRRKAAESADNSGKRLLVREVVREAAMRDLARAYEEE